MNELDVVRVIALSKPHRPVTGSYEHTRQPRIGDEGMIVHVLESGVAYVVECVDDDGMTLWLADFGVEEIEAVV